MWETTDPDGTRVVLSFTAWRHICARHPQLFDDRQAILEALPVAERIAGRAADESWLYVAGIGPSRFVKVVVHYEGPTGRISTAFPRRRLP